MFQTERHQMGAIVRHADVRRMLATARAEVFAARAICLSCAAALDMARAGLAVRGAVGHLGDVGVVHVAGEEGDRARRAAALSAGDGHDELEDLLEAGLEGRPVLEVDDLTHPLPSLRRQSAEAPRGEHLVDRLEVVQPGRQE